MQHTDNPDGYVLDRTAAEYERLKAQAAIWAPLTERVLDKAGMRAGMTVLDAGCGPCEVMRLMNRRVGTSGHVTGVDIDAEVGAFGLERLNAEEEGNFAFHSSDLTAGEAVPGAPFDMIYCRFFLLHMDNPVDMVRKLTAMLKPGGTLIAMDYVLNTMQVAPDEPTLQRGIKLLQDVFAGMGRPLDCGVRLAEYFSQAGLPMISGSDVEGMLEISGTRPSMLSSVLESLSVPAAKLNLCSEDDMKKLTSDIRDVAAKGEHVFHWPTVTAVWTRLPE